MAKRFTREEIKQRFQASIDAGQPIVIASAGIGIAAKFAERGGADMIGLFNSSYLGLGRVEATSLMPYGNANDIVMSLGDRIFPVVQNTPILGGIIGSDPTREMTPFLKIMQFKGFPAVINFPSPGRQEYHRIVSTLARRAGVVMDEELLFRKADAWEIRHGGVSGRAAQPFVNDLAGFSGK